MNLFLGAHPDDETFACGGLIARAPETWHVAVLADGVTSRGEVGHLDRHDQFKAAMAVLGVTSYESRGLADQRLDALDFLDLAKGVSEIVDRIQPTAVYTHFRGDLNLDHRLVCEAVHVACRPPKRIGLYECEVPSSTEWGICEPFRPNVFMDLHGAIDQKLKAVRCYETEVRPYPHPRSIDAIRSRAAYWGQTVGVPYVEAFMLVRELR